MGAVQEAYEIESVYFEVLSMVVPVLITTVGVIWAYKSFNKVTLTLHSYIRILIFFAMEIVLFSLSTMWAFKVSNFFMYLRPYFRPNIAPITGAGEFRQWLAAFPLRRTSRRCSIVAELREMLHYRL